MLVFIYVRSTIVEGPKMEEKIGAMAAWSFLYFSMYTSKRFKYQDKMQRLYASL